MKKPTNDEIADELETIWTEYVVDAEHQDGYAYWDNFANIHEVINDLGLYIAIRSEYPHIKAMQGVTPQSEED
jgi:hypothetical protein